MYVGSIEFVSTTTSCATKQNKIIFRHRHIHTYNNNNKNKVHKIYKI